MASLALSLRKVYCCGSVLPTRLTAILQARSYEKKYSRLKEDVVAYSKFKKELSATRVVFQKELRSQKEMSMEEFNSQAAEEARLARETEAAALEANKIELERMALKREHAIERAEKKRDEKFLRGTIAKEAWEKKRMKQREREVAQVQMLSLSCCITGYTMGHSVAQLAYQLLSKNSSCSVKQSHGPVVQQDVSLFNLYFDLSEQWLWLLCRKEESSSFITMENMDQKIQEIIDNEIDYNFALSKTVLVKHRRVKLMSRNLNKE